MTATTSIILKLLVFFTVSLFFILNTNTAHAKSIDEPCSKVETVFARGSGQGLEDNEADKFFRLLDDNELKQYPTPHHYELGTEQYNGRRYPAVDIDKNSYENGRDAYIKNKMSAIYASKYGISVLEGVVIDVDILQGYNLSNSLTRE